jgi:hypothetical protein
VPTFLTRAVSRLGRSLSSAKASSILKAASVSDLFRLFFLFHMQFEPIENLETLGINKGSTAKCFLFSFPAAPPRHIVTSPFWLLLRR